MLFLYFWRFRTSVNHTRDVVGYISSDSFISRYLIASNVRFLIMNGRIWLNPLTENFSNTVLSIKLWMSTDQYFSHDPIITNTSQISFYWIENEKTIPVSECGGIKSSALFIILIAYFTFDNLPWGMCLPNCNSERLWKHTFSFRYSRMNFPLKELTGYRSHWTSLRKVYRAKRRLRWGIKVFLFQFFGFSLLGRVLLRILSYIQLSILFTSSRPVNSSICFAVFGHRS